jgi:hypothetical protein
MTETSQKQTQGPCAYCGRALTRGGMSRHLRLCDRRLDVIEEADGGAGRRTPLLHLQVRDGAAGRYWLHLEADGSATLGALDRYLRAIWLECCGHMSRFSVGGWDGPELPLGHKLGVVFQPGTELTHIYDFGAETVSLVKLVTVREGTRTTRRPIALMARNAPPEFPCVRCDRVATHICLECGKTGSAGTLCTRHARQHPHTPHGPPVPVTNSPRLGTCMYDGPAEPPS